MKLNRREFLKGGAVTVAALVAGAKAKARAQTVIANGTLSMSDDDGATWTQIMPAPEPLVLADLEAAFEQLRQHPPRMTWRIHPDAEAQLRHEAWVREWLAEQQDDQQG